MKYLWKLTPSSYMFAFFDEAELPRKGFQSLYAIPDMEAERLTEANSFAGYAGAAEGGHRLWVDCDDELSAKRAEAVALDQGLDYEVWTTGNRGAHIGIARHIEEHHLAPKADRNWVRENIPGADLSIYSALHLFRRPGAVHAKTGQKKQLVKSVPGDTLILTTPEATQHATVQSTRSNSCVFDDNDILRLLITPPKDGSRRRTFPTLAYALARSGVSLNFAIECLWQVNRRGDPWPEDKLAKLAETAFRTCHTPSLRGSGKY